MISIQEQIPAFLQTPLDDNTDNIMGDDENPVEEHYYCQRGMHIDVQVRSPYEPKELLKDCETHGTIMINLVLSDEFIARQLMMDRVELNG